MRDKPNRGGGRPADRSKRDGRGGGVFSGDFCAKWLAGAFAPALLLSLAVSCWVGRAGTLRDSRGHTLSLEGAGAIALGFAWFGLAVFLHSRFFLAGTRSMWKAADFGQATGLLVFLVALANVAYRVFAQ